MRHAQDWVKLAVERGRITGSTVIFWLDAGRAHDAQLIAKIEEYLPRHNTEGLDISILKPAEATKRSLALMRQGMTRYPSLAMSCAIT